MNRPSALLPAKAVALAAATLALAALFGLGFAGWLAHEGGIFMSLVDAGLSWCL